MNYLKFENAFNENKNIKNQYLKYVIGTSLVGSFNEMWKDNNFMKNIQKFIDDPYSNIYEFEVRIGKLNTYGFFDPYINSSYFNRILNKFINNSYFESTDWYQEESYYWNHNNVNIRTNMKFISKNTTQPINIIKTTIFNKNIKFNSAVDQFNTMRFALSLEQPLKPDDEIYKKKMLINPTHIRLKIRKDFIYKKIWKYSFIKIWDGPTKDIAEQNQKKHASNPKYSIELELVDNTCMKNDYVKYLSSLFLKGTDLLKMI
jgi:hypothetical protein